MAGIRRRLVSLGYAARKGYQKLVTAKPSIYVVAGIVVAVSIFLLGGGVFDILEKPLVAIPLSSTRILFFYPGITNQSILDSTIAMLTYSFGVVGIMLMYQSTKYAFKPRQAYILLLVGILFILMAYLIMENLIWAKLSTGIG